MKRLAFITFLCLLLILPVKALADWGAWIRPAPYTTPYAQSEGSAMTYGLHEGTYGKLYILLPTNDASPNYFIYIDIPSGNWNYLSDLPGTTAWIGSNLSYFYWQYPPYPAKRKIFCTKGHSTNEFWCYDISDNSWGRLEDIPGDVYRGDGMALATGNFDYYYQPCVNIYLLKGCNGSLNTNPELWVYHYPLPIYPLENQPIPIPAWERKADLVHGQAADLTYRPNEGSKGTLYAFSGCGNGDSTFWRYDIASNTWSEMPRYHNPRYPGIYEGSALGTWGVAGNELIPNHTDDTIYAFRGGSSRVFDAFICSQNQWDYDAHDVPSWLASRVYHGSDLACGLCSNLFCWMYAIFGRGYPNEDNYNVGAFYPYGTIEEPEGGEAVSVNPVEYKLIHIFPNPVSERATFQLLSLNTANSNIEIYDNAGRLIHQISVPAGTQEKTWDTKNNKGQKVLPGVYFYKVKTGNITSLGKFIVQR